MEVNKWQPDCILPNIFFEGRMPIAAHPESIEFSSWAEEQIDRATNGFEYGGYRVTGSYYFFLNFWRPDAIHLGNGVYDDTFPFYSEVDQEVYNQMQEAEEEDKGFMMITGRGFGKTIIGGSIIGREYSLFPQSESIICASTEPGLVPFWNKLSKGLNNMPSFLNHQRIKDTSSYIKSGFKEKSQGEERVYGFGSTIEKVIFDNKPGKTRGRRPNKQIFEEIGSWTGSASLIECYRMSLASWTLGTTMKTFPLLIGTGGEMKSGGSEDAKEMAYNPDSFNLKSFIDPDLEKPTCKFIPAFRKFGGTYESTGVSDIVKAKTFLNERREAKKSNSEMYYQEIQEFPFTLAEAFMTEGGNFFESDLIYKRLEKIYKDSSLLEKKQVGNLHWKKHNGKIIGIEWEQDPKGIFEIIEHPKTSNDGNALLDLYVSGCDSYDSYATDSDKGEDKRSKGSIFVYKRHMFGEEISDNFVAKCTFRHRDSNVFYEATCKLNYYYKAKMLFEHTKIGILDWYIRNKQPQYLLHRPKVAYDTVKETTANNKYGLAMPHKIKHYALDEYRKHMVENIDQYYFVSQLEDALEFDYNSSKHDETMASCLAIVADLEMFEIKVKEDKKRRLKMPKYVRDENGKLMFR